MKDFVELNKSLKADVEAWDDNKDHGAYWCCPTQWMRKAVEYGAENIFLVCEAYQSHYHDDYAVFTYYNNVTGEYFTDNWATAYAAPAYGSYKCTTMKEAFEMDLIDKPLYFGVIMKDARESLDKVSFPRFLKAQDYIDLKLLVDVSRGRKWKGRGYVIGHYSVKYGWSSTTYAIVYDPESNQINEVNFEYCDVAEIASLLDGFKKYASEFYDSITVDEFFSDYFLKKGVTRSVEGWLAERSRKVIVDFSKASYPARDERDRKRNEFRERKMPELIEWVKANTDKEGDQIIALAQHIFNKRYCNERF